MLGGLTKFAFTPRGGGNAGTKVTFAGAMPEGEFNSDKMTPEQYDDSIKQG
jgi:hypothetical protein